MKKLILALVFLGIAGISCKTDGKKLAAEAPVAEEKKVENPVASYKVNAATSTFTWKGTKPAGSHNGDIKVQSGVFDIENGTVKAGEFLIDMNTINCLDLEAGKGKEKLEGHLKSADFFDTEKFPASKFVVTSSEVKEGKNLLTGNLTLRDSTKSVTIPTMLTVAEDGTAMLKSEPFKIDRTTFGVSYKSKTIDAALKDKFIDDLIELSFDIQAKK